MRTRLAAFWMLLCAMAPAAAQVSIGIGFPNVSIGINLPLYPELVPVPGYPVYYAPRLNSNYFFYDGMYWVYQGDNWYASSWYNGPWGLVAREAVPVYVLRVPVRYYRQPPAYFHGWRSDAPPRWGDHWGNDWARQRSGWDQWNRSSAPAPAPLPAYQRQYSGDRYPRAEQQQSLQGQNYRYQPRDPIVREHYQTQQRQGAPAPAPRGTPGAVQERGAAPPPSTQRSGSPPAATHRAPPAPRAQPTQRGGEDAQRSPPTQGPPPKAGAPVREQGQQGPQGAALREQPTSTSQGQSQGKDKGSQGKGGPREPKEGKGAGQDKDGPRGDDRGGQDHRK
jgi:hypothetical protein